MTCRDDQTASEWHDTRTSQTVSLAASAFLTLDGDDATRPRGTQIPILVPEGGEERVLPGRVSNVPNQDHDAVVVLPCPGRRQLRKHRGGINVIPIMEVVVVVETRTKILT